MKFFAPYFDSSLRLILIFSRCFLLESDRSTLFSLVVTVVLSSCSAPVSGVASQAHAVAAVATVAAATEAQALAAEAVTESALITDVEEVQTDKPEATEGAPVATGASVLSTLSADISAALAKAFAASLSQQHPLFALAHHMAQYESAQKEVAYAPTAVPGHTQHLAKFESAHENQVDKAPLADLGHVQHLAQLEQICRQQGRGRSTWLSPKQNTPPKLQRTQRMVQLQKLHSRPRITRQARQ